jgi:hypothetical protein
MLVVVAAATMAPVSRYWWSLRHNAERGTASGRNVGSAQLFDHARQPRCVSSRALATDGGSCTSGGRPQLSAKKYGRSTRKGRLSAIAVAGTLECRYSRCGPPSTSRPSAVTARSMVARA